MRKFRNIIVLVFCALTFYSCSAQKRKIKSSGKGAPVENLAKESIVDTFFAQKNKVGDKIPAFNAIHANGKVFTQDDLSKGEPILFVLFNPSCGHCQILLEQVRDNIALYENVNIVFFTGKPLKDVLPNYVVNVKVDQMKEINVVSDDSDITLTLFEYEGIPQIMLYNKKHELEFIYYKDATNKQILTKLKP